MSYSFSPQSLQNRPTSIRILVIELFDRNLVVTQDIWMLEEGIDCIGEGLIERPAIIPGRVEEVAETIQALLGGLLQIIRTKAA